MYRMDFWSEDVYSRRSLDVFFKDNSLPANFNQDISDRLCASSSSPHSSTSTPDDFKMIMRRAKMLVDPAYKEAPLPEPHHPAIKSARERKKTKKLVKHQSVFEDTTQVNYEDAGDRAQPDSSDEEAMVNLTVMPPLIMDDEESSMDNLLRDAKSDIYYNPLLHNSRDENVFGDEEDDFISADIDLARQRQLSVESHSSFTIPRPRSRPPGFERDLFEGSLDLPDLPPPTKGIAIKGVAPATKGIVSATKKNAAKPLPVRVAPKSTKTKAASKATCKRK